MNCTDEHLRKMLSEVVTGIDTLWGGDIVAESGVNRVLADAWLSD
jgi:hypothetical protein